MSSAQTIQALKQLPAIKAALDLLRADLPTSLRYHAYAHTEDVLQEAVELAQADGLSAREVEIIAVAAAWHDVGFIWASKNNEPLAADAARRYLESNSGYSADEVVLIGQMILDTALMTYDSSFRQVPSRPLSCYLLDADLANFGRQDFFEKSELQRQELGVETAPFREKTLALVKNHSWLTPAAYARWQQQKEANIAALERLVRSES